MLPDSQILSMTNPQKCTDEYHLFQVRFICEHEACRSFLCCACFQTHKEDTGCTGVYGVHIKEFQDIEEEQIETPLVQTPKRKTEEVLQEHNTNKSNTKEKIQRVLGLDKIIQFENEEKLDDIEDKIVKHLRKRKEIWKGEHEKILNKSIQEGLFTELEGLKKKLEDLNFESKPFSKNSLAFKELDFKIIPEAEKFIRLTEQAMDLWRLNQSRLNDYANTIYKVIDGIEYEGLLHEEKLKYKIENFTELSEDLRKLNVEVEDLRKENGALRSLLNKVENEKKSIEDLGSKATGLETQNKESAQKIDTLQKDLDKVTAEKTEFKTKIEELEKIVKSLESDKENLTNLNKDLTDKCAGLENEKNGLKASVDALNKEKVVLAGEADSLKKEKDALITEKDNLSKEITALKTSVA